MKAPRFDLAQHGIDAFIVVWTHLGFFEVPPERLHTGNRSDRHVNSGHVVALEEKLGHKLTTKRNF